LRACKLSTGFVFGLDWQTAVNTGLGLQHLNQSQAVMFLALSGSNAIRYCNIFIFLCGFFHTVSRFWLIFKQIKKYTPIFLRKLRFLMCLDNRLRFLSDALANKLAFV
jgi:hypothetical protein